MIALLSRGNLASGIRIVVFIALAGFLESGLAKAQADARPNIVLLVVDDMGYSDLPRFGGEVDTPNIDTLASQGVIFTNFHVLPSCSPTRSVLLSAVDNHLNGLGTMPDRLNEAGAVNQRGQPGYLGYLNNRVATAPELLQEAGYHTYMAGKWHLAAEEKNDAGFVRGTWPIDRGFERSYGVLEGGSDQFGRKEEGPPVGNVVHYFEDDQYLTDRFPPPGFYTTKNYTQKIVEYIDSNKADGKPFFVYWAPNTPHWPLQAPDAQINKYVARGTYNVGWDAIRVRRFNRMKELGLIPARAELPPRANGVPAWDDASDPAWQALLNQVLPYQDVWGVKDLAGLKRTLVRQMVIYTAMIDYIDVAIGELIAHLKDIGEYDNTIFVFLSDNGPDAANLAFRAPLQNWFRAVGIDNRLKNLGRPNSLTSYAPGWAQVSGTPFFSAKLAVGEAGIRAPMIMAYPGNSSLALRGRSDALVTVQDILPTLLHYAGVFHPAGTQIPPMEIACDAPYLGRIICPMNGKSMANLLHKDMPYLYSVYEPLSFELFGTVNKALVQGDFKVLKLGDSPWGAGQKQPWKLFDLRQDPMELNDLASELPLYLQDLTAAYDEYEQNVGFIPYDYGASAAARTVAPQARRRVTQYPHWFD